MIQRLAQSTGCGVRQICATLGVSRSSYYHAAQPTATQRCDQEMGARIEATLKRHRRRYGYRRIARELADEGGLRPSAHPQDHVPTPSVSSATQELSAQDQ